MATPAALGSVWTEHRNPEGRTYWFNTGSRESVWEKPEELKTNFERALNQTKWKEYFSGGRKYYYHTETKESKWDTPEEVQILIDKVAKETPAPAPSGPPTFIPGENALLALGNGDAASAANGPDLSVGAHTGGLPFTPTSILPARPNLPDDPIIPHNGFQTFEEGEKAFMHLLRKAGVDASWTWDQTMRAIITDPLYKALGTLAEKKAAWQKFTDALKAKEHEEREARLSKLRPALRNMLKGNPNVFHYTTFATADKLFAQHPTWQQGRIEAERKLVFEEYVAELKQREVVRCLFFVLPGDRADDALQQESRAARSRSIAKVVALFKELDVDVLTRWRKAHEMVLESDQWQNDPELRKLPTLDILLAFEDYSRVREREFDEQMRRAQVEKTRKERKAREGFKELMQQFVTEGKIKARTKWKEIYAMLQDDERYLSMLGNPGSNPLELFWDVVDELDQKLDGKIAGVSDAIKQHNSKLPMPEGGDDAMAVDGQETTDKPKEFSVDSETKEEDFIALVKAETVEGAKALSDADLKEVFQHLREQALKKQSDDKRRAERKQRHLQDDLRYALKKMAEPLDLNLSFEEAMPLIENLPEYKAVADDEGRRAAFSKFVKRQKERLREVPSEDGSATTSRKRKEPARDERDKDRERDSHRDRDRGKDYEKDARPSKHYHRHDSEYEAHRSSHREYSKDKEYPRDERDRDYGRSSKHYERDDGRKRERERDRKPYRDEAPRDDTRERSLPARGDDRMDEDRVEKRPRYDEPPAGKSDVAARDDTPEEGEI
ncbi:hypothetical protein HWV62_3214 [Athelia sp. TMB]|nr:hypothetical protein HWV62_3214 [Athelia sp. TMB]